MKTMISKKPAIFLALMVINLAGTFAQGGSLTGWIGDKSTAVPLPYATIIVEKNGTLMSVRASIVFTRCPSMKSPAPVINFLTTAVQLQTKVDYFHVHVVHLYKLSAAPPNYSGVTPSSCYKLPCSCCELMQLQQCSSEQQQCTYTTTVMNLYSCKHKLTASLLNLYKYSSEPPC
jgi:hypothetical protein